MMHRSVEHWCFVTSRLWRYFALYFLKPFDAINDTLTASILSRLDWSGSVVEIGSGDGVYSYVMHGGSFPISYDRYVMAEPTAQGDIYDYHKEGVLRPEKMPQKPCLDVALDAKFSHTQKIKEIGFARLPLMAAYERLPFADASLEKVFYYTPHGLKDHTQALLEVSRVLQPEGRLLILLYNKRFEEAFLCHRLGQRLSGRLGCYFRSLDNGRYAELTAMARTSEEWEALFADYGFRVARKEAGLSAIAWRFYDIQTRPLLKSLIKLFSVLPPAIRTTGKILWMLAWYPALVVFYLIASREYLRVKEGYDCYFAYEFEKQS